jgi:hypothetical protein
MRENIIALSFVALGLTACNSFAPNLGERPFKCGTDSPRCPDGYECISYSPTEEVCERKGVADLPDTGPIGPDARTVVCNDDSEIEPNDSLSDPTLTSIPQLRDSLRLVTLAICPEEDQDFFRFDIDEAGKDARIDVTYQSDRGELLLDLLNSTGVSIRSGTPLSEDPNTLRAEIPNMPTGTYYAQVRATEGVRNNYNIEITTSGP